MKKQVRCRRPIKAVKRKPLPGSLHSTYKGHNIYRPGPPYGWWTVGVGFLKADTLAGAKDLINENLQSPDPRA